MIERLFAHCERCWSRKSSHRPAELAITLHSLNVNYRIWNKAATRTLWPDNSTPGLEGIRKSVDVATDYTDLKVELKRERLVIEITSTESDNCHKSASNLFL
jgi:hypothetical protein